MIDKHFNKTCFSHKIPFEYDDLYFLSRRLKLRSWKTLLKTSSVINIYIFTSNTFYFEGWGRTPTVPGGVLQPSGSDPGEHDRTLPHPGGSPQASHSFRPGSGSIAGGIREEEIIINSRRNTTPMVTKWCRNCSKISGGKHETHTETGIIKNRKNIFKYL